MKARKTVYTMQKKTALTCIVKKVKAMYKSTEFYFRYKQYVDVAFFAK